MAANSSDSGRIVSMDKKSKNKKKGTALLYVKGVGNYSGTKKMKFKIH